MKNLMLLMLLLIPAFSWAQDNQYLQARDADPEAKAILEKLKQKFDNFNSVEAQFTLTIELPEEPVEVQKGRLAQKGDRYRVQLDNQEVISDGNIVWLYLKNNNEVQINKAEEDEGDELLSPKDLLKVYEKDDYTYALTNAFEENGRLIHQIEFKPLDDYSEYSKMRLTVDKAKNEIVRIKVFSKDGSRYTLEIDELTPNKAFSDSFFVFDKSKYPGVRVEDLRID